MIVCTDEDFDGRILAGIKRQWAQFEPERSVDTTLPQELENRVVRLPF